MVDDQKITEKKNQISVECSADEEKGLEKCFDFFECFRVFTYFEFSVHQK